MLTVLATTNQLLHTGLVGTLLSTARELTGKIEEVRKGLITAKAASSAALSFGASEAPAAVPAATPNPLTSRTNWDTEHALLGFLQMLQQVDVETSSSWRTTHS